MIPISDKLVCYDYFRQDNGNIKVTYEPCDKEALCHEPEMQTFESQTKFWIHPLSQPWAGCLSSEYSAHRHKQGKTNGDMNIHCSNKNNHTDTNNGGKNKNIYPENYFDLQSIIHEFINFELR